jgi:hypothetical protein
MSTLKYLSQWLGKSRGHVPENGGDGAVKRFKSEEVALRAERLAAPIYGEAPGREIETVTLTIASQTKIKLVLNAGSNVELTLG